MEIKQRVFDYLWLDVRLRKALEHNQLEMHYQPKIARCSKAGYIEALLRWRSPERGVIPPLDFISCAQESRLIVQLGCWVMLDVVRQVAVWRDQGVILRTAIKVSARQTADQTIFRGLQQALPDLGFDQWPIGIELTESCLIENQA